MNYGGDAAEQVVRMSLEGVEVAARITGTGAKNIAILLAAVLKEEQKTKGKARLTNMLKSGKELKVYTIQNQDLKKFSEEAKLLSRYSISSAEQLAEYKEELETKLESFEDDRYRLRLRAKRKIPEDEKAFCQKEIFEITSKLKELRKELRLVNDIEERSPAMERQLEQIDKEKQREVRR